MTNKLYEKLIITSKNILKNVSENIWKNFPNILKVTFFKISGKTFETFSNNLNSLWKNLEILKNIPLEKFRNDFPKNFYKTFRKFSQIFFKISGKLFKMIMFLYLCKKILKNNFFQKLSTVFAKTLGMFLSKFFKKFLLWSRMNIRDLTWNFWQLQ